MITISYKEVLERKAELLRKLLKVEEQLAALEQQNEDNTDPDEDNTDPVNQEPHTVHDYEESWLRKEKDRSLTVIKYSDMEIGHLVNTMCWLSSRVVPSDYWQDGDRDIAFKRVCWQLAKRSRAEEVSVTFEQALEAGLCEGGIKRFLKRSGYGSSLPGGPKSVKLSYIINKAMWHPYHIARLVRYVYRNHWPEA